MTRCHRCWGPRFGTTPTFSGHCNLRGHWAPPWPPDCRATARPKAIAEQLVAGLWRPHLRASTALPDLPHPARSQMMTGHTSAVRVLAGAPDGSWLASAYMGEEVRIWDPVTGPGRVLAGLRQLGRGGAELGSGHRCRPRHTLTGHTRGVWAWGMAPDGSWLSSAGEDGEVRSWDPVTGTARHTLTGHTTAAETLGVAPDGSSDWPPPATTGSCESGTPSPGQHSHHCASRAPCPASYWHRQRSPPPENTVSTS
jgi:hypothetical protein